jgi:hypothetical protein
MKKLICLLTALIMAWCTSVNAQQDKNIPDTVKAGFARLYPGVTDIKWKKEEGHYEATFTESGKQMSLHLSPNGDLLEREWYMKERELPTSIQEYVERHYHGKPITEVSKTEDPKGLVRYEVGMKGKELIFDEKGMFIKEEKEE